MNQRLLDLIEQIYDAAGDPVRWEICVSSIHSLEEGQRGGQTLEVIPGMADTSREQSAVPSAMAAIPDAAGAGDDANARTLALLQPHLTRALGIHQRLLDISLRHDAMADALDRIGTGVVFFDAKLRAFMLNRAAIAIFERRDGPWLRAGMLRVDAPEVSARLETALRAAVRATSGPAVDSAVATIVVPRPSGARPYQMLVASVGHGISGSATTGRAAAAVFVIDPDRATRPREQTLREAFHLTPTEARLAASLAEGLSLAEVAERHGLTRESVRWHLKQVFAKAGVSSQAQLVRLLVSGLPPIDLS